MLRRTGYQSLRPVAGHFRFSLPFYSLSVCGSFPKMNYLVCDGNILGRYVPRNFKQYPVFTTVGCTSHLTLADVLNRLERPQIVVVASLGSILASAGSMESPVSRPAGISACLKRVWADLLAFSEEKSETRV
jgi:hypothetical protein